MKKWFDFSHLRGDLLGGITAGVVALPLALAFGVSSGLGPSAGLYGAIFVSFFASLFGGTATQISGPTAPMTAVSMVVIAGIVSSSDGDVDKALPIILGLKTNISSDFVIGVEFGFRYTFTDNIDSSNPIKEFSDNKDLKFGELSNKDWYTFSGITFSYTFGRMPCYCKEK